MDFPQAVKTCFQKYVTFEGRASRPEFWWFMLACLLGGLATGMVSEMLNGLFNLAVLLPSLAVGSRRLHDIGKSAWFLLLWLVPIIGWGILIYWACQPGDPAANAYGEPAMPAAQEAATPPGAV
ncbi:MAG: DUF805 domain-containing protein [Burkholderiales bacterium]|nr:DUF805 domain-containing protein [Burkholderiales bacterium]